MQQDLQQLKLLSIFYYIWGGLACLGAVIGAISLFVAGTAMSSLPSSSSEDAQSQAFMGPFFIVMGIVVLILGLIYGVLAIMAGGKFKKHQGSYVFCLVVSIITCITSFPIGTALGIYAIVILMRPTVKALFRGEALPGMPQTAAIPPVS
jgi:hypothetical protein